MINRDFHDLFATFAAHDVRHVIVGGCAVGFHGHPRHTKDVDVLVDPSAENAARVYDALLAFGALVQDIEPGDPSDPECVLQIGIAPTSSGRDLHDCG